MHTASALITLHIPQANSLKDKRQVAKSIIERARRKFNISAAEVDTQDIHRTLTLGIATVSGNAAQARKALDEVIRYIEDNADAEVISIETDV